MVRSSRASSRTLLTLFAAVAVAGGTQVSAHRLDELLQATRIAIEPDRVEVEMSLTPGTAVAGDLIREIDVDGNGAFSEAEKQTYADRALSSLVLHLDEGPRLRMAMAASSVPDAAAMRTGDAVIVLRAVAVTSSLAGGPHSLFFRNEHAPVSSVYLANALVPESDRVAVTGQERDSDQRALTIQFSTSAAPASTLPWMWIGLAVTLLVLVSESRLDCRAWPPRMAPTRRRVAAHPVGTRETASRSPDCGTPWYARFRLVAGPATESRVQSASLDAVSTIQTASLQSATPGNPAGIREPLRPCRAATPPRCLANLYGSPFVRP